MIVIAEKITPASTRRFRKEADSVMVPALEVIRKSERTSNPVGFARTRALSHHTRKNRQWNLCGTVLLSVPVFRLRTSPPLAASGSHQEGATS